mmetsp:Transcript_22672/g.47833  ORF Transcript_22672/g.47833 Transcript_22672/m.47833 type:complete len:225 (-) Transcript_22672:305-979(-)
MKLHVLPISANSHGCLAVVKHLKLDEEGKVEIIDAMGKTRTDEFIAMNPCHCCPTLEFDDDKGAIWESCAVMRALCEMNAGGEDLYPADPITRAKINMVMDWKTSSIYPDLFHLAYMMFGVEVDEVMAKKQFAKLLETHFPVLLNVFLKDTPFCFSDKPTIADLAVAPIITLLKGRKKFYEKVPDAVKEYYQRVYDAFPGANEYFKTLDDMCSNYDGPGADAEP